MQEEELLQSLKDIRQGIQKLGEMLQYLLAHVVDADEGGDSPHDNLPPPKHFKDIEKHRGYLG